MTFRDPRSILRTPIRKLSVTLLVEVGQALLFPISLRQRDFSVTSRTSSLKIGLPYYSKETVLTPLVSGKAMPLVFISEAIFAQMFPVTLFTLPDVSCPLVILVLILPSVVPPTQLAVRPIREFGFNFMIPKSSYPTLAYKAGETDRS